MSSIPLGIVSPQAEPQGIVTMRNLHVWFGKAHVLKNIHADFLSKQINGIVGPSGSGKSTLIRSINRMNDEVAGHTREGTVCVNNHDIYSADQNTVSLRTDVGMVFQKPSIFPLSIAGNVLFGIRHHKKLTKHEQLQTVEDNLNAVSLWREVRHRLDDPARSLSLGQQQRLCIARTLAV
ncbi:MAG: ATP-binding cassette domain-containing protein, partial [Candidatus Latescibacteria bacterium]|nr:ATP-binding cassette domain-containing protein [Candidatus Latescibacterota bacterium]